MHNAQNVSLKSKIQKEIFKKNYLIFDFCYMYMVTSR